MTPDEFGPWARESIETYATDVSVATGAPRQGQGLGRAAMLAAEELAANNGRSEIGLNVFGFNERAQDLYRSLGYRVVNTTMAKDLRKSP
ncbi:MAG: hypothetical protein JWN62_3343 [Acidimicrobiales bacterium]|nr:hypothetical protein [Acidimicrobiales bacterium]